MEPRRRADGRRARALAELEAVALLHPDVRPRPPGQAGSTEDLAAAERRRIVESWTARHAARWAVLVGEVGDVTVAEDALVAGAVRGAAGERKPCDPAGLAEIEACVAVHPGNALAAVIQPQTVWDMETALAAAGAAARGDRYAAIASIGFAHFGSCAEKLRERVAWVEQQLPFASYPRASATLRAGCELVATQEGFAAELGCALLEGYVRLLEAGFPGAYVTSRN